MEDDERTTELSTIAAIYPELVVDDQDPYSATLDLSVTPVQPLRVVFKPSADGAPPFLATPPTSPEQSQSDGDAKSESQHPVLPLDAHELFHLPPLSLRISLPTGYPANEPPIISLSVTPQWLPQTVLRRLKDECARLWEELGRDQVVYAYIDHIQQEAEQAFGFAGETEVQLSSTLKLALLNFDLKTKRELFEKETFDCGICLEPKKGVLCHRLTLCGHVFCIECLQEFYKSCITEGDIDSVKCLAPNCSKDEPVQAGANGRPSKRRKHDRTLSPTELLQIPIEQELVLRYLRLKRKKRLEIDKNTTYCPRQWCQGAAKSKKHPKPLDPMNDLEETSESEEEEEEKPESSGHKNDEKIDPESLPMSERLAVCEDCDFAFCRVCLKGWHGVLARCSPRRERELDEEEKATQAYLKKYSTPCPECNTPAQKIMGCNHMTCFKCKSHFCYLCAAYLMPDNPYSHYNDPKSSCHMRLWVLEEGDGEGVHHPDLAQWDEIDDADEDSDDEELPPENFAAFQGDHGRLFADEEDTDDEEPAPDQRRNRPMHIEIVNFARPGAHNPQRIELPERPREIGAPVPPQAPHPPRARPRRRGGGQQANRQRAMANEPARAGQARGQARGRVRPPAALPAQHVRAVDDRQNGLNQHIGGVVHALPDGNGNGNDDAAAPPPAQLPLAAPGQGNHPDAAHGAQAGAVRAMGLERFLQLAQQDQEDEWDSDELEEDDFRGIEHEHEPRRRGRERVMGWRP
ncbi:uncharacterized protein Z520_04912 [Fonsecaea multimorphosa CBS 102226]|uniref:RBR-type E3 ubiquitin transferase n=1 Tax=Fonsecaea multimorphosa CBS 102226 TaxID=1442371 RepID=A0A0D2IQS8_9EURO|nr:uncharacterized protein Z520_04912 [Fonsecaea multimorphosa CBS 102226]KIX99336.1 hypothetical protein Z520_04912 [Fonsecaea multimorphosa CBS 102226]OAL25667.1 hypothetical protein AYO22_04656 [Fonsecaea multimorphosa]